MHSFYMSAGMSPLTVEGRYLPNSEYPPLRRALMYPEDWYKCKTMVSLGQRARINEWHIEREGMVVPRARM